LNLQPR